MIKLFGTDGIRGIANQYPITAEMAIKIGQVAAQVFSRDNRSPQIIIGKDTRLSGDMLESGLIAGICSVGAQAFLGGIIPTPGMAYRAGFEKLDKGISGNLA
jgi:phosphoglucosamine mutase